MKGGPEEERGGIVHGDLRVDNMLFSEEGGVEAVVDWELSTLGEPFTDVGLLMTPYWTEPDMPIIGGLKGQDLKEVREERLTLLRYTKARNTHTLTLVARFAPRLRADGHSSGGGVLGTVRRQDRF